MWYESCQNGFNDATTLMQWLQMLQLLRRVRCSTKYSGIDDYNLDMDCRYKFLYQLDCISLCIWKLFSLKNSFVVKNRDGELNWPWLIQFLELFWKVFQKKSFKSSVKTLQIESQHEIPFLKRNQCLSTFCVEKCFKVGIKIIVDKDNRGKQIDSNLLNTVLLKSFPSLASSLLYERIKWPRYE